MKKKMALLLAAALTMTTILTGCGGGNEENADKQSDVTAEDAKEENASGDSVSEGGTVFTVGFDAEYPPYGYMDENGEYTGFDLELAQAVCDLEGWELVKKPINWDSKDMELNSGSIDCIWNGFTMNGREDDYTFSDSYVDNSQVIVVAEDSGIDTLDALAIYQLLRPENAKFVTVMPYLWNGHARVMLEDESEMEKAGSTGSKAVK
mgnify:CR=1 FL=1